ncbi:MAG: hypothetical protein IPM52_03415 [Bacteroidetes bacterium]|nr:hypothetical protein [Bacteroidota bacterium]
MLVNLSNHPFKYWPEEQRNAAMEQFGQVHDMPFPNVDPVADLAMVSHLAAEIVQQILDLKENVNNDSFAVHVMGELTINFQIVDLLRKSNIRCVASTTTRETVFTEEGKLSKFRFVRFRDYYAPA